MKKIILLLVFITSLLKAGLVPYTLENLKNLNIYYVDKSGLFTKKQQDEIKKSIDTKLTANGFNTHGKDPSTLVLTIKVIDIEDTYIANIVLLVGEEVITKRDKSIETIALSYYENKFFELDEPEEDIKESINLLIKDFIELYKEDME